MKKNENWNIDEKLIGGILIKFAFNMSYELSSIDLVSLQKSSSMRTT